MSATTLLPAKTLPPLLRAEAWVDAERGRFVPWLAVAMVAGALLYLTARYEPPAWWPAAGCALALAVAIPGWRTPALRAPALRAPALRAPALRAPALRAPALRALCLVALAVSLGFGAALLAARRAEPMPGLPPRATVVQATIRSVDVLPDGRRLVLSGLQWPGQPPLHHTIRIRLYAGDTQDLTPGDRIEARALLRPPDAPAYPGGWDQQRDAWFAGSAGGGIALGPVKVLDHAPPHGLAATIEAVRTAVARRALDALPGAQGAIAATLLSGMARSIPDADRAAFRDSGLAHLLAVAGLHIGIVMGLFMLAARLLLAAWPRAALHWPTKSIAATIALSAGLLYLLLTGAHVPILRSFTMAAVVTLAIVTGRRVLSMRALALAAAALVLFAPAEVVGVSFQMSFAAVAALIAGYEALRPLLARLHGPGWRRLASHAAALVLTSALAGTASAAYGAYHFGHVQLYYVVANVAALPLTAFWVLPCGILALALMPLGLQALAFAPMGWGIAAILWIARTVAAWPAASLPVPAMPGAALALFSLGLAWLCLWRSPIRLAGLAPIAAALAAPLWVAPPDILVSSDARLIAWRGPAGYALQAAPGAPWFVRDAWRSALSVDAWRPLDAGCDGTACRLGPALLLRARDARPDCAGVQLLVAAEPARDVCPGAALIDRFAVWRDGPHAVWLGTGAPVILSDRADRGARPWVPPPPTPRRRTPTLPMAPLDAPPAATEN